MVDRSECRVINQVDQNSRSLSQIGIWLAGKVYTRFGEIQICLPWISLVDELVTASRPDRAKLDVSADSETTSISTSQPNILSQGQFPKIFIT